MKSKREKAFLKAIADGGEVKTRKVSNSRYQRFAILEGKKFFDDVRVKIHSTRKRRRKGKIVK